jgi:glycosyltransferase involved in cell wall biosynthesis
MRILHVTEGYLPRLGGIELHVHDLATRQRAAGLDAQVVTLTPAGVDPECSWVHRVEGARPGDPPSLRRAAARLDGIVLADHVDVVHVHVSVFSPFATLAAHRSSVLGLPTLITVHSMWTRLGPAPVVARDVLGLRRWPVLWSAVSSRAAVPVRELLGPGREVHVLPNAVDPAQWSGRPTWAERRPAGAPLNVVSVMRLTHVKRSLPLVRVLRQVRRAVPPEVTVRAVVVGDGPRRGAMEHYVRRHALDDVVAFTGRLDRAAIRTELQRGAVFLAPAIKESFGIAPLEARAVGLPVVASLHAGVSDFVVPGVHGFLAEDDAAMAAHVVRLLTDDDLRTRIARHNRTTASEHDWDAALAGAARLYDLAGRRDRVGR